MSSGAFKKGLYTTDNGDDVKISFQPETETFTAATLPNTAGTGEGATGFPSAVVSKGRRTIGINTRLIRFKFDSAPAGYQENGILTIPVFSPTTFAAYQSATTGTYDIGSGAEPVTIVGTSPEKIR